MLTNQDIEFINCLKMVPKTSLWGVGIHLVLENPTADRLTELARELRSQALDNPGLLEKILGSRCFQKLLNF